MSALKSILVPVDFSDVAANAFAFALRLADKYPARVDLLYCMPTALSSPGMDRILVARAGELNEEAKENMDTFRRKGIHDRLNFTRINGKKEVEDLLRYAKTSDADVVVMNRPHRGWLERLWKRSHTREAMLKTEVPLLILHGAEAEGYAGMRNSETEKA